MTTTTRVRASNAYDMLGPYLTAKGTCPGCHHENVGVHMESYASSVKWVSVCAHLRAIAWDDDGDRHFEFSH
jgi:hypothetical protein